MEANTATDDMMVSRKSKAATKKRRVTRTLKQHSKIDTLSGKERKAYAVKTDVHTGVLPQLMSNLTAAQVRDLDKFHENVPQLVFKEGDIVGVLDDDMWRIRRVRFASLACGTRTSAHQLAAAAATDGGEGSSASAFDEDTDEGEGEAGGEQASGAHRKRSTKKKAKSDKKRRQAKRGANVNMVQTVKGEALAYVLRYHYEERKVNSMLVKVLVARPVCFKSRRIASADEVRKFAHKYEDLTAFDANPERPFVDYANLYASAESQDEGFDAAAAPAYADRLPGFTYEADKKSTTHNASGSGDGRGDGSGGPHTRDGRHRSIGKSPGGGA